MGLESESEKHLNGQSGVITRYVEESGRFEVRFVSEEVVGLLHTNLRQLGGNASAHGASSSPDPPVESQTQRQCSPERFSASKVANYYAPTVVADGREAA